MLTPSSITVSNALRNELLIHMASYFILNSENREITALTWSKSKVSSGMENHEFISTTYERPPKKWIHMAILSVSSSIILNLIGGTHWLSQWLEHATDDRVVADTNPTDAAWKLWQFPLPHFANWCLSE